MGASWLATAIWVAATEIPGTGLGLSLVHRVAHDHGGDVAADSAPGCGSTFRRRLPAAPAVR